MLCYWYRMDKDLPTKKMRTKAENWALLGDFNHQAKSMFNPITYEEVLLTNFERANQLVKRFSRFSNTLCYPQLYILARSYAESCFDLVDAHEKKGSKEYTVDHVINDVLEATVQKTALRIVT